MRGMKRESLFWMVGGKAFISYRRQNGKKRVVGPSWQKKVRYRWD